MVDSRSSLDDRLSLHGAEIVVVDDDPEFRKFVCDGLRESGASCLAFGNGAEAIKALMNRALQPDVILLDVMMPDVDGWDVLTQIRSSGRESSVVFVTAREAVDERVRGLRMGADDYIIKPFAFVELLARIETVIRRRQSMRLQYGNLTLHRLERECLIGESAVNMTAREFALLCALVEGGSVLSRTDLLKQVWQTDHDPETNVVEVHVARLRRKLSIAGGPEIVTERGKGYCMGPKK
ncbi:MAG: DNA-binding response OmpR family regulator [Planctomycetota bacterium]|jgi:DNA-binding response OmpR family regulator